MENQTENMIILSNYLRVFTQEVERQSLIANYLKRTTTAELYSRKNFDGHITASAFIINHRDELLLLHHKSLDRWLQPGGHVDVGTDLNILAASLREVEEETGIPSHNLSLIEIGENNLFDIDSHLIPDNPRKEESAHYHHDFRYLFRYEGNGGVAISEEESLAYRWVKFDDLLKDEIFKDMVKKIRKAI